MQLFLNIFLIYNGVKQGGVIPPVLYCIYIDGLLIELEIVVLAIIWGVCLMVLLGMLMILNYVKNDNNM